MDHPLQQKVRAVGHRARRLQLVFGLSLVVGLVAAAAFAVGLADYVLRVSDAGVRVIASGSILLLSGWAGYRFLWPAWRQRWSDIDIAQRIESRYPQLHEQLSSAMQFLSQSETDAQAGSAALRRAVIVQATDRVDRIELVDVIDPRVARRAAWLAGTVVLLILSVSLFDPRSAWLAARRLAEPWAANHWPRVNDLALVNPPSRLAAGQDFEVEVTDRNGRLPAEVKIHYWHEDEQERDARVRDMQRVRGRMVHRMLNVTRSFRYRVAGGDDDSMPWITLEVVEPPRVSSVALTLVPPAYTGWPPETVADQLRALEGTRVEVRATATKPLSAARVHLQNDQEKSVIPARLVPGEPGFELLRNATTPWVIKHSGAYWFDLVGRDGLSGGSDQQWEVRAVPDRPPTISLDRPEVSAFVTPDAVVPLRALVKDDLAIRTIALRFQRSDSSSQEDETVELYRGPDQVPAAQGGGLSATDERGETRGVDYTWDLSQLEQLASGTTIAYRLAASDYKPQEHESTLRQLTIITPDELQDRIARRQAYILSKIRETLRMQIDVRSQATALEIELEETGFLVKSGVDQLQGMELGQRQIRRRLIDPDDSVLAEITALVDQLKNNRVVRAGVSPHLSELSRVIRQLESDHLPIIQNQLIRSWKASQADWRRRSLSQEGTTRGPDSNSNSKTKTKTTAASSADEAARANRSVAEPLSEAGRHQDAVIAALEQALGELSQWDRYQRFARDVGQLRRDHQQLDKRAAGVRQKTLARDVSTLTPSERADLKKLAQRQSELARQLDKIQGRMQQACTELDETEPLAAETIRDALQVARRLALSGRMRQRAGNLERNQFGRAGDQQRQIDAGLQELLDVLSNRPELQLHRLLRKQREAAARLQELLEQQKGLRNKLAAAQSLAGAQRQRELQRLARQQQDLAHRAESLRRRLQRLQAESAGQHTGRAASQMGQAAAASEQGDGKAAEQAARQAAADLEQAQQQLAQRIAQTAQDLVRQQLARMEQQIQALVGQQQAILAETQRLQEVRGEGDEWGMAQRQSLHAVADQQRGLAAETAAFARSIEQAEVFSLALEAIAGRMRLAADRLDREDTGTQTTRAEEEALRRLQQLLDALQPTPGQDEGQNGGGGGGGAAGTGQDGIRSLEEIKLLRLMQQSLNQRTVEIEQMRGADGRLTPQGQRELQLLSQEQGRLAELILQLSEPASSGGAEEELDDIPGPGADEQGEDPLDKSLEELLIPAARVPGLDVNP